VDCVTKNENTVDIMIADQGILHKSAVRSDLAIPGIGHS
jgi:hypothetical protein